MHSSRMRTSRLLTVSQHALGGGGVYPSMHWAGWYLPGGVCLGVSAQGLSAQGVADTPQDQRQTPPPPWTE